MDIRGFYMQLKLVIMILMEMELGMRENHFQSSIIVGEAEDLVTQKTQLSIPRTIPTELL